MAFNGSGQKRKFLEALKGDKQTGMQPSVRPPMAASMGLPASNQIMASTPHIMSPKVIGAPAQPGVQPKPMMGPKNIQPLPTMPKFDKLKNYFKKPGGR